MVFEDHGEFIHSINRARSCSVLYRGLRDSNLGSFDRYVIERFIVLGDRGICMSLQLLDTAGGESDDVDTRKVGVLTFGRDCVLDWLHGENSSEWCWANKTTSSLRFSR